MAELRAGEIVAAKYRLDRLLGEGGMGIVWAATHLITRKLAALKFVKAATQTPEIRRRFLREARAACAVKHPNVVEVHDVIELDDGSSVMVMEYLLGESLADRLERGPKLSLAEVAQTMLPVVSAVGTAHTLGIIHRDLKPHNIFLVRELDGTQGVRVLDFGIAKLTSLDGDAALTAGITGTGAMLGTPCYMSPEQAFGEKDLDHRADIWALGIILYQCLTGVLPTEAGNVGQVLKIVLTGSIPPLAQVTADLPGDVTSLVGRMLSRERGGRPDDLRGAKKILEAYAGFTAQSFGPPSIATPGSFDSAGSAARPGLETLPSVLSSTGDSAATRARMDAILSDLVVDPLAATSAALPPTYESATPPRGGSTRLVAGVIASMALAAAGAWWFGAHPGSADAPTAQSPARAQLTTSSAVQSPPIVESAAAAIAATSVPAPFISASAPPPKAWLAPKPVPIEAKPVEAPPKPEPPRGGLGGVVEKPPF